MSDYVEAEDPGLEEDVQEPSSDEEPSTEEAPTSPPEWDQQGPPQNSLPGGSQEEETGE
jgi:hypothetical protein